MVFLSSLCFKYVAIAWFSDINVMLAIIDTNFEGYTANADQIMEDIQTIADIVGIEDP